MQPLGGRQWTQATPSHCGLILSPFWGVIHHCHFNSFSTLPNIEIHVARLFSKALGLQGRQRTVAERDRRLTRLLALLPRNYRLHYLFGNLCESIGSPVEAVMFLGRAIELDPNSAAAHNALGVSYASLAQAQDAISHLKRAVAIDPDYAEAHHNLGCALGGERRHEDAAVHFERAVALRPSSADMQYSLGTACLSLGRLAQAQSALEKAIDLDPRPTFYLALSECTRFNTGNTYADALIALERKSASLPADERIKFHFALGNAYRDLNRHALAFAHWSTGNLLKRRRIRYDEDATLGAVKRIARSFTKEVLLERAGRGDPSTVPVFIVGMPRSGTTLIEQIVASHPEVSGAGEIGSLGRIETRVGGPAPRYPEDFANVGPEGLRAFGSTCIQRLRAAAPGTAKRITDKVTTNFWFLGLIHLALPNARIIHVRRDPIDTCVSCYSKLFDNPPPPFAYDLAELGRYFRAYEAVMDHWRRVLPPGAMIEVNYEDVVADVETEARRIIAFCDLEWTPACLAYNTNGRHVATASSVQVRQPIYRTSIGGATPYREFLGPLIEALGAGASSTG